MRCLKLISSFCLFSLALTGNVPFYKALAQASKLPEGYVEIIRPEMTALFSKDAKIEVVADGFKWAEGPVWVSKEKMLLFSDVPNNKIYKWTAEKGKELYLEPSGYTLEKPRKGESGSNGLAINIDGQLVLCQTGNRIMAIMDAPLSAPKPVFKTIADNYMGKKFDTPNDLTINNNGDIYFTDPPYGLTKAMQKDAPYQGVYKIAKNGKVTLLVDTISRPNGIALFPDGKNIIIANSDPAKPFWYIYDLDKKGLLINGRVFYDGREEYKKEPRTSDGIKIDTKGNVYAPGPGGVWIFNKKGVPIGRIKVNVDTSNCTLSYDTKTLFITAGTYVLKITML